MKKWQLILCSIGLVIFPIALLFLGYVIVAIKFLGFSPITLTVFFISFSIGTHTTIAWYRDNRYLLTNK